MKSIILFFVSLFLSSSAYALSEQEKSMLDFIQTNVSSAESLLEKTVNINSGSRNMEGVREVGMIFKKELDDLDFKTRWISMPKEMHRAGHLFATMGKKNKNRILLIGHLDTVFDKTSPFQTFKREGNMASGPGASDMKGGIVAMIQAFKALAHANILKNLNLTVALMGDEEDVGLPLNIARKDLIEVSKTCQHVLAFESSGKEMKQIAISRRGYAKWELTTTAPQGHSSKIFGNEMGDGAAYETARILTDFRTQLRSMEYLTFNPGIVAIGTSITSTPDQVGLVIEGKPNIIAPKSQVNGDIRFITQEQYAQAKEKMHAIVNKALPKTSSKIVFEDFYPSMEATPGNQKMATLIDEVSREMGIGEVTTEHPMQRGAADISFVAKFANGVDGMGVLGFNEHSPDEKIDLQSIPKAAGRAAITMHRLSLK